MIYNYQMEQNLLGAIFHLNGYGESVEKVLETISVDDIYDQVHKKIYLAMLDCQAHSLKPDVNAVSDHRFCSDYFAYCLELTKNTVSGMNILKHAESLKKLSELRHIQDRINSVNEIISSSSDIDEKLKDIEQLFSFEFGATTNDIGAKHISDCIGSYVDYLDKRWNNPDEVLFTSGIPDLDNILGGGFEIGLHGIFARPKMGKTELMGKIANHTAVYRDLPIYIGSLEMQDDQVMHRLTSAMSRVDKDVIKGNFVINGYRDAQEAGAFDHALMLLAKSNAYLDTRTSNTVKKIRREVVKIVKKHGSIGMVLVDYLGLLENDGKHDRHDLSVAHNTRALKNLSKEFNCPVIMLGQLNRGLESRGDKRPIPSDSRDSGSIEQDCSTWTAIYKDSVYDKDSKWGNIVEIIVRLNRDGGSGTCYQQLTGHGFVDADIQKVAELVHMEEEKAKKQNQDGDASGYVGKRY